MNSKNSLSNKNKIFTNNFKSNLKPIGITLIIFAIIIIIYTLYTFYISFNNFKSSSPYLIDGITDGTMAQQFSSGTILSSSDLQYGTEFTYSFWIFIKDTNFINNKNSSVDIESCGNSNSPSTYKHIFHKGSYDHKGNHYPILQSPGVWLYPNTNKIRINMNTYNNLFETTDIGNIPLNMWVCINIILIGRSLDIYINGNLKKRHKLIGVPKFNYEDLYTSQWHGFDGYLSRLRYFNYAIEQFMIDQIYKMGPSSQFATDITSGITQAPPQLAPNYWMTSGYPNSTGFPNYNQSPQTTA
jgi:hypothetical protein